MFDLLFEKISGSSELLLGNQLFLFCFLKKGILKKIKVNYNYAGQLFFPNEHNLWDDINGPIKLNTAESRPIYDPIQSSLGSFAQILLQIEYN